MEAVQPALPLDWVDLGRTSGAQRTRTASDGEGARAFSFADLFAGIGGFHAALAALGGNCVFASEIDPLARTVYRRNWSLVPAGDMVELTTNRMGVPRHDVLAAGFPCQPFSKSGHQRGMGETRGTLFWSIARVLEERRPAVILLENVRNLAGPRHRDSTWRVIVRTLRDLGYRVAGEPTVFSPHLLQPELGGRPQFRERVFIAGTYVGRERAWDEACDDVLLANRPVGGWDPQAWDIEEHLPLERDSDVVSLNRYRLSRAEIRWINIWDDLITETQANGNSRPPTFPVWADALRSETHVATDTPRWKAEIVRRNVAFYRGHQEVIDSWLSRHNHLRDVPPSRRKLEWQAQDAASLWDTVLHFRPSGIRARRPTYVPALVAIAQTSIVGRRRRRITPREAARLQGFPDWFDFGAQTDAACYKQLGNAVNIGAAYHVLRRHVRQNEKDIATLAPGLVRAVRVAPASPDPILSARFGGLPLERDQVLPGLRLGASVPGVPSHSP